VTTDPYTNRAANAIPNPDIDITTQTVEDIMRERGVGKRYAYSILKQMSEEQNTSDAVPDNQRERILAVLYRGGINNSQELKAALHHDGYEINGHDTVKVLWSLQKTGHVKFRERQSPRMLFAIRLTDLGKTDGRKYATRPIKEVELVEVSVVAEPPAPTWTVTEQEVNEGQPGLPWIAGNMKDWPALLDLRDRANRAKKLNAAAKILEEAGEDDMVLALMAKTDFTPLETEVIRLLEYLKEIE